MAGGGPPNTPINFKAIKKDSTTILFTWDEDSSGTTSTQALAIYQDGFVVIKLTYDRVCKIHGLEITNLTYNDSSNFYLAYYAGAYETDSTVVNPIPDVGGGGGTSGTSGTSGTGGTFGTSGTSGSLSGGSGVSNTSSTSGTSGLTILGTAGTGISILQSFDLTTTKGMIDSLKLNLETARDNDMRIIQHHVNQSWFGLGPNVIQGLQNIQDDINAVLQILYTAK